MRCFALSARALVVACVDAVLHMRRHLVLMAAGLFLLLGLLAGPASASPDTWSTGGTMAHQRSQHTATLLPNGKVLVVAGNYNDGGVMQAELYDPPTNTWSAACDTSEFYHRHTANLLPDGRVIIVGGMSSLGTLVAYASLYDPASNTRSLAADIPVARWRHTATVLRNGKLLVVGGLTAGGVASDAWLYDPATNAWSSAGSLASARTDHTATLLPSGKVLIAGGADGSGPLGSAELYDPATNHWSAAGSLTYLRSAHTATLLPNGKVLVAGGYNWSSGNPSDAAELYDPSTNTWTTVGFLLHVRYLHTATLLPSGKVLVAGGTSKDSSSFFTLSTAELFDPATNTWSDTGWLATYRKNHTATLLANGKVLAVGGDGSTGFPLGSAELYDPATTTSTSAAGALSTARFGQVETLLPGGQVLVAGGGGNTGPVASAELYTPGTNAWSSMPSMADPRSFASSTLLPSGKVLVAGGYRGGGVTLAKAELYDPAANAWSSTGPLATAHSHHTATLLQNGWVLAVGGYDAAAIAASDLYDPATNTWTGVGSLQSARFNHTATLLPNGTVLVAGGDNNSGYFSSAELWDPVTKVWSPAAALASPRSYHTATLLPNGKVLVAGGASSGASSSALPNAEVFDPATNTWSSGGALSTPRYQPTATLLSNGKVLLAGGIGADGQFTSSTELYDPATNTWSPANSLAAVRYRHTATLLANGKVLIAGGGTFTLDPTAEVFDAGIAPAAARQPALTGANAYLLQTSALTLTANASSNSAAGAVTATGLMPPLEAGSGATNNSASNAPVVQVQRIDSGQMWFVSNDEAVKMTDTSFTGSSTALAGFPAGPVYLRVWVNGVPSAAKYSTFAIKPAVPAAPTATGGTLQATVNLTPTDDGGAPITGYTAIASPGGATATCIAPCTSITFNLIASGTYTFTVHATNAAGDSPESASSNSVIVDKASPALQWTSPASIVYGTPLSSAQLNATATYLGNPVPGTFTYTPAPGTLLSVGMNQTLSVDFVPTDATRFTNASTNTSITIGPAALTITADNQSRIYGSVNPTFTWTPSGFVNGDTSSSLTTQPSLSTTATQASAAGTYAITPSGAASPNYAISYADGTLNVTPADLTISAENKSRTYGAANPAFTWAPSGFVNGDTASSLTTQPNVATTATPASPVGTYAITPSGAASPNYTISYSDGTLTILQAASATSLSSSCIRRTFVENQPFTLDATVAGVNATGHVTFDDGLGGTLCSNVALTSGTSTCTNSTLAVIGIETESVYNLTASYGGDENYTSSSTVVPLTVTVLSAADVVSRADFETQTLSCPIE